MARTAHDVDLRRGHRCPYQVQPGGGGTRLQGDPDALGIDVGAQDDQHRHGDSCQGRIHRLGVPPHDPRKQGDDVGFGGGDRTTWEGDAPDRADELAAARLTVLERQGRLQEYLYLAKAEGQTERYATMPVRLGRGDVALTYARAHRTIAQEALTLAMAFWERGEMERGLACAELGLTREGPKGSLAA
jgi:hypothetical protein